MAKPKGATLTRLFAVSDAERKAFWQELEAKKDKREGPPVESGEPESGIPRIGVAAATAASLPNFEAYVTRVPISGTPVLDEPDTLPLSDEGIPVTGTPVAASTPSTGIHSVIETGTPVSPVPFPVPFGTVQPEDVYLPALSAQRRKVREAVRVQDGHSLGEQAVYATLWALAQPDREDRRRVTIGYRTLSDACGLTVNNCKANLQALARKLAIEPLAAHTSTTGTTYLVHSYPAILRRRRQAGMTHVIKTKGVVFVNPETGAPVSGVPVSLGRTEGGAPETPAGTPLPKPSGVPDSAPPIRNQELREEKTQTEELQPSSSFPLVVTAAASAGIPLDDDAARRIVLRSKAFDENATETEVAHFVRVKADQLRNSRSVGNVVGLLIKAVPQYFMPPATELANLRQRLAQEAERLAQQSREASERSLQTARECLIDPDASDAEREWARSVLSNAGESS